MHHLDFIVLTISLVCINLSSSSNSKYKKHNSIQPKAGLKINKKCLIHNQAFKYEYLLEFVFNESKKQRAYTKPLSFIKDFKMLEWTFRPVESTGSNETLFIIKSGYSGKYLCASNEHLKPKECNCKKRRIVYTIASSQSTNSCWWKVNKILSKGKKKEDTFYIINWKYNEPLYSVSSFINGPSEKRAVYCWHKKPDSKAFIWNIDCQKGEFLTE
jgi:hypothetical protein